MAMPPSTIVCSASRVKLRMSPEPVFSRLPSVSSAVWPGLLTWTLIPLRSSQDWRFASVEFASSTNRGTWCWKEETWSETGLESRKPMPVSTASTPTITIATGSPRDAVGADDGEREHDHLDPARHDHRRHGRARRGLRHVLRDRRLLDVGLD